MTRYADGPTVEVEAVVHAAVEAVWDLVTDISLPARFSSELRGAEWLDAGPALGARFVGHNAHPSRGEWDTTSWVTRFEPQRAFGWAVSDPDHPSASWWFELDNVEGGVLLCQGGRMGPAPSGLTIAIRAMPDKEQSIVARRLEEWERNMRATVEGIKELAEGRL